MGDCMRREKERLALYLMDVREWMQTTWTLCGPNRDLDSFIGIPIRPDLLAGNQ